MKEAIIGLLGVLIGAGASIIGVWIQTQAQLRQNRLLQIQQLAIEDHKCAIEIGKMRPPGQARVMPIVAYLAYHLSLAQLMDKKEKITEADLEKLTKESEQICEKLRILSHERLQRGTA